MKEDEAFGEMELRDLTNEPYTIMVKYHEGASRIGGDIHGVMCDLASSETVELKKGEKKIIPLGVSMKLPDGYFGLVVPRSSTCINCGIAMGNSVGIIENDYCGESDVWGFVAIALEDTTIEAGTRIAQFMPVAMHDWATTRFEEPEEWPYPNRGGYGSTGEKSNGGEPSFYDRRGRKLTVGCYCRINGTDSIGIVKELYESKERGPIVLADFSGYGEMRKRCVDVELDERPHDCDGVPIEVGDVLYRTDPDGEPIGDPLEVEGYIDGTFFAKGHAMPMSARTYTHREPADSWEKLEEDALKYQCAYFFGISEDKNTTCVNCKKSSEVTGIPCRLNMQIDLVKRAKRLAGVEEQEGK